MTSTTLRYRALGRVFSGFSMSSTVLVINPNPWYARNTMPAPKKIFLELGQVEVESFSGFIERMPAAAKRSRIPTFIETIKSSDFPTAFAPIKLVAVKTCIIAVEKILAHMLVEPGGRKVTA